MLRVLQGMGASQYELASNSLTLQVPEITKPEASYDLVKTMRASVLVLGPTLARCGQVRVSPGYTGHCRSRRPYGGWS